MAERADLNSFNRATVITGCPAFAGHDSPLQKRVLRGRQARQRLIQKWWKESATAAVAPAAAVAGWRAAAAASPGPAAAAALAAPARAGAAAAREPRRPVAARPYNRSARRHRSSARRR